MHKDLECNVFPEPSIPSMTMKTPSGIPLKILHP